MTLSSATCSSLNILVTLKQHGFGVCSLQRTDLIVCIVCKGGTQQLQRQTSPSLLRSVQLSTGRNKKKKQHTQHQNTFTCTFVYLKK